MSGGQHESKTPEKKSGIMRVHVLVVCSTVGLLGFVILILGVAGEAATTQALVWGYSDDGKCQYRTTPALGLGIVAALLAVTAQVVVTATSLCCGCCRTWEVPTDTRRIVGIVFSAVSWVIVIIVVALFIAGAALNADHESQPEANGDCSADDAASSVFAAATVLSVAATGLQIASYILLQVTPTTEAALATQQPELATVQPAVELQPKQNNAEEEVVAVEALPLPPPPSAPVWPQAAEPACQV